MTTERTIKLLSISVSQRKSGEHAGRWSATARVLVDGQERRIGRTATSKEAAHDKVLRAVEGLRTQVEVVELDTPAVVVTVEDVAVAWKTYTLPTMPRIKSPGTRALYASTVDRDLVPKLGTIPVAELTAHDIEVMIGARAGQSGSTRRRILTVLRFVLDSAQRDGHVTQNVARLVGRAPADKPKPKAMDSTDMDAITKAMKGERLEPVFTTLAWLGCRIGELLAIATEDVFLEGDDPQLFIRGSLVRVTGSGLLLTDGKSDKARRWIPLTPAAVAAIKRWKATQAAERLAAGPFWEDTGYLFTSERGTPMDPGNVAKSFRGIARKAGVKASPHRLRHTLATDLLANGVSLREVQELLGHASPMTTASMYQSVTPAHKRATMDKLTAIRSKRA